MHIIQFYRVTVGYDFSISLQWEHISLSANKALDHSFIFTHSSSYDWYICACSVEGASQCPPKKACELMLKWTGSSLKAFFEKYQNQDK